MAFVEATDIYFIQSPLTVDNEHVIRFESENDRMNYFMGLPKMQISMSSFQRDNTRIRLGLGIEQVRQYNYVVYRNSAFNGKWMYNFIDKLEYVNNDLTHVYIKLDVMQTWWNDFTLNYSFVERQHKDIDEFNTLADAPSEGQLVQYKTQEQNFKGGYFVFCSSNITSEDTASASNYTFTIQNYTIPCMVLYYSESEASKMSSTLQSIANKGWADRIVSAVYVPCIGNITNLNLQSITAPWGTENVLQSLNDNTGIELEYSFDFSISDTDPLMKYKKSLTFPYAKLVVMDKTTNQSIELCPEKFDSTIAKFKIQVNICETPSYKIIPMNYCGELMSYRNALVVRCNTSLPVLNNSYAKYMMMNSETNGLRMLSAGGGIASSLLTMNGQGIGSGIMEVANVVAQQNQASKQPNQVSSFTDGAMERILFNNGVKFTLFTMDNFHQDMALNFWKMYGYPVKSLALPLTYTEKTYRYMKLIKPNIEGDKIPSQDMREIEQVFEKGVTIWQTPMMYKKY